MKVWQWISKAAEAATPRLLERGVIGPHDVVHAAYVRDQHGYKHMIGFSDHPHRVRLARMDVRFASGSVEDLASLIVEAKWDVRPGELKIITF